MPNGALIPRPPVVAVMGHIDHGKSTLLDYIRRTNVTDSEIGGITQRISAYEVEHIMADLSLKKITFLDTPGHESFSKIRARGASVADVAVLVVSAEDGVKPQTLDALKAIRSANVPFVVAINKIDKPNADIEKTKMSLAENEVFVEGFGGDVTVVPISAKTGKGISTLLDMILLTTDVLGHTGNPEKLAEGIIIEARIEKNTGTSATLIIKDGTLITGNFVVCGTAWAPVRYIEDFKGKKITKATFSSPVKIIGWSELPDVGEICVTLKSRDEAEELSETNKDKKKTNITLGTDAPSETFIPIVIKADAQGAIEAIIHEINKINNELVGFKIIHKGIGDIRENDVKAATTKDGTVMIAFNVTIDKQAEAVRERNNIEIKYFSIIYELADFLKELKEVRTPRKTVEEMNGVLKVLKVFSKIKDRQVIGGRVETGTLDLSSHVKIMRRENEIGRGQIKELQCQKIKTSTVKEGSECGILVEAKMEIMPGDKLESFISVVK